MKRLIVGCGYLGIQVARLWLQQGDQVTALTRDINRFRERFSGPIDRQIHLVQGDIVNSATLPETLEANTVLFAVGMDRSRYQDIRLVYVEGLKNILANLAPEVGHFIYVSSTGVYGSNHADSGHDPSPTVDEDSPTKPTREGGQACLAAEELLKQSSEQRGFPPQLSILRFAGIYGFRRVPFQAKIKAGEWDSLTPEGFLNLIHVQDGARIIQQIADSPPSSNEPETLIVSDGNPVLRKEFYEEIARLLGTSPILWQPQSCDSPSQPRASNRVRGDKKLVTDRLRQRLKNFRFAFPNYRMGLSDALNGANRFNEPNRSETKGL